MSESRDKGVSEINPNLVPVKSDPDDSLSRAAIYARTSVSKAEFHYSIPEQVNRCWEWCNRQDWQVLFVFTDEAETGRNTDREGFQNMLDRAETGCIDVVVFWKLDRFCRSLTDLVKTEEKLNECGVALQSVTEYIDTASPVGRFTFRNLASAAELESDLTSQRVRIGMHGMAKANRWPNSQPPHGYDLADDQTLVVNKREAETVRWIYNTYLEERSMPVVAHELNEQGTKTSRGNEWSRWSVRKVLSNQLYRGRYQLGDYTESVEAYRIVSDELFDEVTDVRHRFRQSKGSMEMGRKEPKAQKILSEFKKNKGRST